MATAPNPSRGPEAVREALIEAATELFANNGDASVRAVAQRAGVNHGLVHHYFGGKSGLRAAVLRRLFAELSTKLDVPPGGSAGEVSRAAIRATEQDPRGIRLLARALLDGDVPHELQTSFPVVERLIASSKISRSDTRAVLAESLATALGALVFGPWIRAALALGDDEFEAIRGDSIANMVARLEGEAQ